jgi:acetyl-CoA carboxylase carboxyltransferase component
MSAKKRDASSWGVGGDDPVYGQPTEVNEQPGLKPSQKSKGQVDAASDPVYSQAHAGSSRGTLSDPVYGQPAEVKDQPDPRQAQEGKGHIDAANDPVYSQPHAGSSKRTMSDPVYAQSQSVPPAAPGTAAARPGQGQVPAPDDPVYSQSQAQSSRAVSDPVYGQPLSLPSASPTSDPNPSTDKIPPQDGPVSSQAQSASANTRLNQLSSHIAPSQSEPQPQPNIKRPLRRKKSGKSKNPSALPDDYSDILAHLGKLRQVARTPDLSSRGYQRQKTSGKLWARERIEKLLDANTWEEFGSVTGTVTWERDAKNPQAEHVKAFIPSNNPQGFGTITPLAAGSRPRRVYLTSDDFSLRSGHADGATGIKTLYGEKLALRMKVPVVKLVDGSSGGGSVSTIMTQGYSYMPHVTIMSTVVKQLNMGIPNIGAVVGPAIGLGAARVVATHFSVMAGDIGSLFNAGPKVVEGATFEEGLSFSDLGGPEVHCRNGTIDNLARDEEECFAQIRTVLGYLPDCGLLEAPPCLPCSDPIDREDIALRSIIPRKKSRMYNPYTIILSVVDRDSWFEIGGLWGRTGITGLARLGGRPVGILSLNCEVNSGALDAMGSQKLMKMLKFCDVFNLPVVQFVDVREYFPLKSPPLD